MADFIIPKGKEYKFTISVKQKDSFIAQDLTNMNLLTSSFSLIELEDGCAVSDVGFPITMTILNALNGVIEVTMPSAYTSTLAILRGSEVDGYYLKPVYQGVVEVKFTDATMTMLAVIEEIYVTPTGCIV